jgi:hypothetical protein
VRKTRAKDPCERPVRRTGGVHIWELGLSGNVCVFPYRFLVMARGMLGNVQGPAHPVHCPHMKAGAGWRRPRRRGKGHEEATGEASPSPNGASYESPGIALGIASIGPRRALKGRTSSRERPWSHSLKRPFRAHSRIGSAITGAMPRAAFARPVGANFPTGQSGPNNSGPSCPSCHPVSGAPHPSRPSPAQTRR